MSEWGKWLWCSHAYENVFWPIVELPCAAHAPVLINLKRGQHFEGNEDGDEGLSINPNYNI